jgi:hypothetical protein
MTAATTAEEQGGKATKGLETWEKTQITWAKSGIVELAFVPTSGAIYQKKFNCPVYFLQALEVLKRLKPNPFEFATSDKNEDSKWQCTFSI